MKKPVSVKVVKYHDMPSRQWYMSPHHKSWYYHAPRTLPSEELSPKFLDATLDPPLRLLALGLNSIGYTTLPSCSGHYKTPQQVDEAYDHLVEDARQIRRGGLELIDVESGEKLQHEDPTWYLPWDRRQFAAVASGSDSRPEGYIGFNVPKSDGYKVGKAVDAAVKNNKGCRYEVKRSPTGYVFELRAYTGKQRSQDEAWRGLGVDVMDGLTK